MKAEHIITAGHRTNVRGIAHSVRPLFVRTDKMAGRKRARCSDEPSTKSAKRQVTKATFEKWQREHERDHQTLSWLRCELERDRRHAVCHIKIGPPKPVPLERPRQKSWSPWNIRGRKISPPGTVRGTAHGPPLLSMVPRPKSVSSALSGLSALSSAV